MFLISIDYSLYFHKNEFLFEFKQRLIEISCQELTTEAKNTYSFYDRLQPHHLMPADYLKVLNSLQQHRLITMLRTRSLPLQNNLDRINICDENKCARCQTGAIDNELHFIFKCQSLAQLRKLHLLEHCDIEPTLESLQTLLNTCNPHTLKNLCSFVKHSLYESNLDTS